VHRAFELETYLEGARDTHGLPRVVTA
jgi:hypothetical protein